MSTTTDNNLDIDALLTSLAESLAAYLEKNHITHPLLIGIHTGGVWIANYLKEKLKLGGQLGTLDISFYRDDFTRIGLNPEVKPSDLPFKVDNQHIILVDDVLNTGRTIRAALNEIFDYGRPASISLAILVEREGRELPVQADVSGIKLSLPEQKQIKLTGPTPLGLAIVDRDDNTSN